MASTVIRVKRRITDEPFDKFVLDCKRQKTNNVTATDEIGAKSTSKIASDPIEDTKTILKLAATVSTDDDLKTHLIRLRKGDAVDVMTRKKHKPANVIKKLREQLKDDAQNSRFKVINCFRSIENDASGDEQTDADGGGGVVGVPKRNITVVDVIKEDSSTKVTDECDQNKIANDSSADNDQNDDRFVYDLYLVQSGQQPTTEIDVSNYTIRPFDDVVYQANDETLNGSDYDSEDSNDEANWRNEYPDTDDDLSIGEEDMRRAVEEMHFSSENASSDDDDDYNYGEEPMVHFMAEQSEETEYNYFKKHGHIRNHAAYYRSKRQNQRALDGHDSDDDSNSGNSDSDSDGDNASSRSSVSSVSPLASCDEHCD